MLRPGIILDNKYVVEAIVGRGGFGYVYRARERLTDEIIALKELTPTLVDDPDAVRRFIQEARATLRLTHPHIARTYNVFQEGNTYYLAMEYLPGGSLDDRLSGEPMPLGEVLRIAAELCAALDYAHRQGVVHCDIKPANVLFDEAGRARLADFGIAHVTGPLLPGGEPTATGPTLGTLRYMSPEQIEGVRDDPRLDLYALGALLYEMLAGRPYLPFEPETTPAAQMRNLKLVQTERPRPLREWNRAVPDWLAAIVSRALDKDPADRFSSAAAMRNALLHAIPVAPVTAPFEAPNGREPIRSTREVPAPTPRPVEAVSPPRPPAGIPPREAPLPRPREAASYPPRQGRQPGPGHVTAYGSYPSRQGHAVPSDPGTPGWQVAALVGLATLILILLGGLALALRFGGRPPSLLPQAGGASATTAAQAPGEESPTPAAAEEAASPTPGQEAAPTATAAPTDAPPPTEAPTPTAGEEAAPASRAEREQELLARVQVRPNGVPVFAERADQPPAVDGNLGEWGDPRYEIGHLVHGPENWQGTADASGVFSLAWDDSYLYLALRVFDDAHVSEAAGRDLYLGDDVEIQIDANLAGDFDATGLDDDDGQVGMAARDPTAGGGEAYVWRPASREGVPAAQIAFAPTEGGYVVEAALPWDALNLAPQPEQAYGFALSLSDNDTPGTQVQESMVSTAPGRLWDDPRTWGTLILVDW